MNESATSNAYPWKKSVIHQPDLTGELYSPMFCLLGRPNPPALVIIPDDSGISDTRERAYAAYFASRGLTCLIIDPFSPLDINQCVDNPRVLSLREMMAETCAAYSLLIVRRNINAVGIVGIGRGGLAAMHLGMSSVPGVPHFTGRFDFIVALSPTCYIQLRHPCPGRTPMLVIIASKDELCDPEQALAYTKRIQLADPEAVIKTSMLPEAHHAWDTTRLPRFNPDAIQLPRVTYYLEENGTYTVDEGDRSWMPGEIVDFLAAKVHYGAHIGGGGAMFTAVCQTIDAFITRLKFFTCDQDADTGLQLLNRMDRRDDLLLRMGRCENLEQLFDLVSTTFGVMPETALVRIWLSEVPGNACPTCHNRELCTNHAKCLHLVASGGHSIVSGEVWNNTDGDFEITQQSKLLRALQEKEYRRVGEEKNRSFHTRIVAATNRDLRAMVAAGTFREDLFYRLNVFPIRIPPLRERLEDIPLLVENFLRKYAAMFNRGPLRMKAGQMDKLMAHSWPGNIRELQNVIQRAVILSRGNTVSVDFLRITRPGDKPAPAPDTAPAPRMPADTLPIPSSVVHTERILTSEEMKDYIRGNFVRAMIKCNGKIFGENGAAALLDMKPTTLLARLRKLGIDKDHPA